MQRRSGSLAMPVSQSGDTDKQRSRPGDWRAANLPSPCGRAPCAALGDLASTHTGTAIVVTHGGVTTDALRTLVGDEALQAQAPTLIDGGVPNCAITILMATGPRWSVESIATTDHLCGVIEWRTE